MVNIFDRKRVSGEEWLIRDNGAYLPGVYEGVKHSITISIYIVEISNNIKFGKV